MFNAFSAQDLVRRWHVSKSEHMLLSQRVQYYWTLDLSLTRNYYHVRKWAWEMAQILTAKFLPFDDIK